MAFPEIKFCEWAQSHTNPHFHILSSGKFYITTFKNEIIKVIQVCCGNFGIIQKKKRSFNTKITPTPTRGDVVNICSLGCQRFSFAYACVYLTYSS